MTSDQKKINVVFSVTNCICFDQRVLKMAGVLERMNANITIIGRRKGDCCDNNIVPYKTVRFRMLFKKGFLFYKFFNIRLFFWLLFNKYDLLVANDLDTLLPNFLISKIKRIPLVYDSHEYFTGLPELKGRGFVKSVWKFIETLCFPHLKYVITVSEGIANIYEKEYRKRPAVIKNFSPLTTEVKAISREQLGIKENNFVVIIQGTGINIDKGGEELIEAIASLTGNIFLIVAGSGDVVPFMKKKVSELNVENRVIFTGTLPWNELISYTKVADAGMVLEKDTNLNYRFS
ncbi:MAG: glycosyltransferase, partial [Bacteroidales bacterium]